MRIAGKEGKEDRKDEDSIMPKMSELLVVFSKIYDTSKLTGMLTFLNMLTPRTASFRARS